MRPRAPSTRETHVGEPRLRVVLTQKLSPYNCAEMRGLPESVARRFCILGLAMPAPKRPGGIRVMNRETGEYETVEDKLGGWSLSADEKREQRKLARAASV